MIFIAACGESTDKSSVNYYTKGKSCFERSDYIGAISFYSKAVEANQSYINAYFGRARAYAKMNNYEQSIADYSKIIEIKPDSYEAYHNRGLVYKKKVTMIGL